MSAPAAERTPSGLVLQWLGVLGPPGAWSFQFLVSYNLADSLACAPNGLRVLGMDSSIKLAISAVTALAGLICVVTGVLSLAALRRIRASSDSSTGGRASWMALAGVMVAVFFLLIIAASFLPVAMLRPACASSL